MQNDPSKTVATVSSNGLLRAVQEGSAMLKVKSVDGGHESSCLITVTNAVIAVTSVTLNQSSMSAKITDTPRLEASVKPDNASNKTVLWSSSNQSVATVSQQGELTLLDGGTTTITAKSEQDPTKFATCVVTVTVPVTGVEISSPTLDELLTVIVASEIAMDTASCTVFLEVVFNQSSLSL